MRAIRTLRRTLVFPVFIASPPFSMKGPTLNGGGGAVVPSEFTQNRRRVCKSTGEPEIRQTAVSPEPRESR